MMAIVISGWRVTLLCAISGYIVKAVVHSMEKKGFVEEYISWDKIED